MKKSTKTKLKICPKIQREVNRNPHTVQAAVSMYSNNKLFHMTGTMM